MKELLKNPLFYYILVPVIVGLWPLLVFTLYIPRTEKELTKIKQEYLDAQEIIGEILRLDPDRLEIAEFGKSEDEFDYATAIEKVASMHRIPPTKYKLNSNPIITTRDQKTQNARISLQEIDILKFAQFLSTIQLQPGIECTNIKLVKKKNSPNSWDVDLQFKYYF